MTMADDDIEELVGLPTTAETEEGPIITHRPGTVEVRYDYEDATGTVWKVLSFSGVIATRFTPDESVLRYMIRAYSSIAVVRDSDWWLELYGRTVGRSEQMPNGLHHYVVYFDHYGCFEVLATNYDVEP